MYNIQTASHESALRKFLALRDDVLLLLGPRRVPPVVCPAHNTSSSIQLLTSVGFTQLTTAEYTEATQKLRPDIIVGIADRVLGQNAGVKRREKMVDRTHAWTRDALDILYEGEPETRSRPSYFAPLPPLDGVQQSLYLQDLEEEMKEHISGFCVYEPSSVAMIPESLSSLPRLSLSEPNTPNDILREVSLGVDITIIPFIGAASDAGLTLDFVFPGAIEDNSTPKPLGYNMWSTGHAMDVSPLVKGCECYACQKHHRAYVQHLLSAKEMLAWTLLQIHNHHIMDNFFSAIRTSIANGTFSQDVETFGRVYENELPQASGQGPRYGIPSLSSTLFTYLTHPSFSNKLTHYISHIDYEATNSKAPTGQQRRTHVSSDDSTQQLANLQNRNPRLQSRHQTRMRKACRITVSPKRRRKVDELNIPVSRGFFFRRERGSLDTNRL